MKGFLILTLISCAFASQDLCQNAVAPSGLTFKFADDPSDCTAYLYCHFEGTDLKSVHQGKCTVGNFNAAIASCEAAFVCTAACEFNPAGTIIRVADAADTTCTKFKSCDGPTVGTTIFECTAPSVFNRNYGICTHSSIAPCSSDSVSSGCEVGKDGFFNDESACDKFFFCDNGVQSSEVCPNGLHFNPTGGFCDEPANLTPPCTAALVESVPFGPEIPRPPHVSRFGRRF
ncbi:hypothetical protein ACKWTF_000656 [Chironomus riparius]